MYADQAGPPPIDLAHKLFQIRARVGTALAARHPTDFCGNPASSYAAPKLERLPRNVQYFAGNYALILLGAAVLDVVSRCEPRRHP